MKVVSNRMRIGRWAVSLLLVLGSVSLPLSAASGRLTALILDESGQPLTDVVVSLLSLASDHALPTLSKTNREGKIHLDDLDPGNYQILIKSAGYRSPASRLIQILPDRTAVVTLILQQLLSLGEGEENVGVKALFRASQERRLVFRNLPAPPGSSPERRNPVFEDAVFQVYSNGGFGGDYFVFPADSWGGTTTNFALVDTMLGGGEYVVAGQLNSGEDSLWRVKNVVNYRLSDRHRLKLFLGYGRVSFEQPSLALLGNPNTSPDHGNFAASAGNSKLLNVGFEESLTLAPTLTLSWGVDVDQVKADQEAVFVTPSARVSYSPFHSTDVEVQMTSKRPSMGNSVMLPEGGSVSLASPVQLARIGDEAVFGRGRHLRGQVRQQLGEVSEIEVAMFEDDLFSGTNPLAAIYRFGPGTEVLRLRDDQAKSSGYRVTFRRQLTDNVSASFSYIRAFAPGMEGDTPGEAVDLSLFQDRVARTHFNSLATQLDTFIPASETHIRALVKFSPDGSPLMTLDALSDVYETGNRGINLFVRQVLPVPEDFLRFFGIDFLFPQKIEALLDVRNLLNDDLGTLQSTGGEVSLLQTPRSVRGGVSFRF